MTQGNMCKKVKEECREEACKDFRGRREITVVHYTLKGMGLKLGCGWMGAGKRGILGNIDQHCVVKSLLFCSIHV